MSFKASQILLSKSKIYSSHLLTFFFNLWDKTCLINMLLSVLSISEHAQYGPPEVYDNINISAPTIFKLSEESVFNL